MPRFTKLERDVMRRAARRLWSHGTRGELARDANGEKIYWWEPDATSWCAVGALNMEWEIDWGSAEVASSRLCAKIIRAEKGGISLMEANDERGPRAAARLLRKLAGKR